MSRSDLAGALAFVGEAAEHEGQEPLSRNLLDTLAGLLAADGISYQEWDAASRTVTFVAEAPEVPIDASTWDLLASLGEGRVLSVTRSKRDFSERDRTLLELLRPHLIRLRANAERQTSPPT